MSEQARNKQVIRRLIEASDRGDLPEIATCYAADYSDRAACGSRASADRAAALQAFAELSRAFPDVRHTIHELIAEGDKVVLRVSATGTHRAEFRGIPASGRTVSLIQTAIYRLRDGQIVDRWVDGQSSVLNAIQAPDAGEPTAPKPDHESAPLQVLRADTAPWRDKQPGGSFWELSLSDVSLTYFRLERQARFEAHEHPSEQITLVLEGRLVFEVEGSIHVLGAGEAIAVPAGVKHAVWAEDEPVRAVDAWSPPPRHLGD